MTTDQPTAELAIAMREKALYGTDEVAAELREMLWITDDEAHQAREALVAEATRWVEGEFRNRMRVVGEEPCR